jgi:hypothetical protein
MRIGMPGQPMFAGNAEKVVSSMYRHPDDEAAICRTAGPAIFALG